MRDEEERRTIEWEEEMEFIIGRKYEVVRGKGWIER